MRARLFAVLALAVVAAILIGLAIKAPRCSDGHGAAIGTVVKIAGC